MGQYIPKIFNKNTMSQKKWITAELKTKIKHKNNLWVGNKAIDWKDESKNAEYRRLKIEI